MNLENIAYRVPERNVVTAASFLSEANIMGLFLILRINYEI